MKTTLLALLFVCGASAFAPPNTKPSSTLSLHMFGGSGSGVVEEEDPEKMKQIEAAAKQMGMSVDEYQLGMQARQRMADTISAFRATSENDNVTVERDANAPPQYLNIKISDEAKAKGKDHVSKAILAGLKDTNEQSKKGREEAQKEMMVFISEEMKRIGG